MELLLCHIINNFSLLIAWCIYIQINFNNLDFNFSFFILIFSICSLLIDSTSSLTFVSLSNCLLLIYSCRADLAFTKLLILLVWIPLSFSITSKISGAIISTFGSITDSTTDFLIYFRFLRGNICYNWFL